MTKVSWTNRDEFPTLTKMDWRAACRIGFLVYLVFLALFLSPWGSDLEQNISRTIEFRTRSTLKKDPVLDRRIRIVAFDDQTLRALGTPELSPSQWTKVMDLLNSTDPAAIFIDKLFAIGPTQTGEAELMANAFKKTSRLLGAVVAPVGQIADTVPLALVRPEFQAANYGLTQASEALKSEPFHRNVYGPFLQLQSAFSFFGHIYYEGNTRVYPAIALDVNHLLPYVGFGLKDKVTIRSNGVQYENGFAPLDRHGYITPNLAHPDHYYSNTLSLLPILERANNGGSLPEFSKGDVIIVLPTLYSGNTDFKQMAYGDVPGGFLHVALFNSLITNNWLKYLPAEAMFLLLACGIGVVLGFGLKTAVVLPAIAVAGASVGALGIFAFVYFSLVTPWLFCTSGLLVAGAFVVAGRARASERNVERIGSALQGLVAPSVLQTLFDRPEVLKLGPSEHVVTVMFVDIVGFSLAAESLTPKEVFHYLKEQLNSMASIVHAHGGVIDKTLGDGLLCFFGYSYDGAEPVKNHALQALRCAEEIQRENAKYCVQASKLRLPASPLRIGLNSGAVYIGNIGNERRIDFTIIGHCVNYARRLEEACEGFRIMMGPATRDYLKGQIEIEPYLTRRDLHVKHHSELWEAFEFDPFVNHDELLRTASKACRDAVHFERKEPRWSVPRDFPVSVFVSGVGPGRLIDFSLSGFAVEVPTYVAQKVQVSIYFDTIDGAFRKQCNEHELLPIEGEVRWGRAGENSYQHGVLIRNLNEHQRTLLLEYLRAYIGTQPKSRAS